MVELIVRILEHASNSLFTIGIAAIFEVVPEDPTVFWFLVALIVVVSGELKLIGYILSSDKQPELTQRDCC
jgi:hypothetical protein